MRNFFRNVSLSYAAGSLGGLGNSVIAWLFGTLGINAVLGVHMTPAVTPPWLYPRLVWGGLWGFLFLLPLLKGSPVLRGVIYSLGPTFVQLFLVFPFKLEQGMMGLKLGIMTPLLVVVFNVVWGVVASLWLNTMEDRPSIWSWKR
jgi:hypothetical protein